MLSLFQMLLGKKRGIGRGLKFLLRLILFILQFWSWGESDEPQDTEEAIVASVGAALERAEAPELRKD